MYVDICHLPKTHTGNCSMSNKRKFINTLGPKVSPMQIKGIREYAIRPDAPDTTTLRVVISLCKINFWYSLWKNKIVNEALFLLYRYHIDGCDWEEYIPTDFRFFLFRKKHTILYNPARWSYRISISAINRHPPWSLKLVCMTNIIGFRPEFHM